MKDLVFGHGMTPSILGSPVSSKVTKSKEEKVKEKVKATVDSKELVKHSWVKNKHRTLTGGQKKVFGGPRVKEARKAVRKVNNYLSENDVRTYHTEKVTSNEYTPYKGRGKDQKWKGKESACPQSGLSASETPQWRRIWPYLGIRRLVFQFNWRFLNLSCWMVWHGTWCMDGINTFEPCQPPDARCSGSWLHKVNWIKSDNQKVPETCVVLWHYDRVLPL